MDKKHFKCWCWKALWGLGVLSFIFAWVAGMQGQVLGYPNAVWFWNALVFGVLAIPIKLDCKNCGICGMK